MASVGRYLRFAFGVCALWLVVAFALPAQAQQAPSDIPPNQTHGIDVTNIDRSVKPGDDFFQYADGEWLKRTEIPPDRGRVGAFSMLDSLSNKRTSALIEEAAKSGGAAGSNLQCVLWAASMRVVTSR